MSNQEILEKAIQKAIDGGWKDGEGIAAVVIIENGLENTVIFDHDFAKALWGDGDPRPPIPGHIPVADAMIELLYAFIPEKTWQQRLQQMVTADDPIKYLGDHM